MLVEVDDHITGVSFIITSTKLNVPVVTLSINDNINFKKYYLPLVETKYFNTIVGNKLFFVHPLEKKQTRIL